MTVHLDRGRPPSPRYPFVHIKPQGVAFCIFTCGPLEIGGKYIHWLGKHGSSAPCLDELCRWCGSLPKHYVYYAPVMEWYHPSGFELGQSPFRVGGFRKAILRITEHMDDILKKDLTGQVVQVMRVGKYKNAPLTWKIIEPIPEKLKIELSPFDVESTMNVVWGIMGKEIKVTRDFNLEDEIANLPGGEKDATIELLREEIARLKAKAGSDRSEPAAGDRVNGNGNGKHHD